MDSSLIFTVSRSSFLLLDSTDPSELGLNDSWIIPCFVALLSGTALLVHLAVRSCYARRSSDVKLDAFQHNSKLAQHIASLGGTRTFRFLVARTVGCFILVALSVLSLRRSTQISWTSYAMAITYIYASLLAVGSILAAQWAPVLTRHNVVVLLVTFSVYVYRDLWQLATFNYKPIDVTGGWILWFEISILAIVSVVVPLFIPRRYIPVDISDPMDTPTTEQTASLFSKIFYLYLDPIFVKANKLSHLSYDELPLLSDYDRAKNMKRAAFPLVDPFSGAKNRHIFFGLIRFFRYEFSMIAVLLVVNAFSIIASPIGINRILTYLETDGVGAVMRPWFWIAWLLLGTIITSLSFQLNLYFSAWILVRTEALLTQLLFEHSLRIRLKAETSDSDSAQNQDETKEKNSKAVTGKINNLITSDLNNIGDGSDILELFISVPLQVTVGLIFLYQILGWSAFAGLASIILMVPVPGYIAAKIEAVQIKVMAMTDERVQTVTDTINVLRMIKMFGWEPDTNKKIDEKRQEELKWIKKRKLYELGHGIWHFVMLTITMLVTYGTFTTIMKQDLSASIVFSSSAVFGMLSQHIFYVFQHISVTIQAKVSLDRVNDFLHKTELLDLYTQEPELQGTVQADGRDLSDAIGFNDASFVWSAEKDGSQTPSRSFKLQINGELLFKRNGFNLIVGPTGSGKTSILMALLGEMHHVPLNPSSWFNLPRSRGISYAAQESWVQNDTIRNNIIFGSLFDENRYKKVLYQCALERDMELFEAGDQTEVGERGLTLSGGQKARVTLARAIYSSAEIILLDDVLAALDVHTSKWIIEKCFRGDLVKGRTVLLVTHNVILASPLADFVVAVNIDGKATGQGSEISTALSHDPLLAAEAEKERQEIDKEGEEIDQTAPDSGLGKLVLAEEIVQGRISRRVFKFFLSALGGERPFVFLVLWCFGIVLAEAAINFQIWYLGYWGSQYETHPSSEVHAAYYMAVYAGILVIIIVAFSFRSFYYMLATLRASRKIHKDLVTALLGTTFRWLDETPTSRMIVRCTQDMRAVDSSIPDIFSNLTDGFIMLSFKLVVIIMFTPMFLFPGIGVTVLALYIARAYLKAQLSIKREMNNAKAPVLSSFGAAINGLVSIRAFDAQELIRQESLKKIDHYTRIARTSWNINRWIGIRMDGLGSFLMCSLAVYLVYMRSATPTNAGFSLNMASDLCLTILWCVRLYNSFEVQSNSLERINRYMDIEQEPKPHERNNPPAAWPSSGTLVVDKLSARYSPTGPVVLHDISFQVRSGERIGIVGRTGSGKSSLTLSLLRCIPTEGNVYYDGLSTMDLNLDALRANITIIPQIPELLSGTLRRNLDPFNQYDDAILNDALRAAGLTSLQDDSDEVHLTLDSSIAAAGGNLSVGQRQIIALARAIVRGSKILILDEATSAIDYKTDSVIQTTLRNELPSDVTVITVAHRLQTIMDADKIMVLDNGRIAEFDSPKILLQKQDGILKSLVDSSDDRAALYTMGMGEVA